MPTLPWWGNHAKAQHTQPQMPSQVPPPGPHTQGQVIEVQLANPHPAVHICFVNTVMQGLFATSAWHPFTSTSNAPHDLEQTLTEMHNNTFVSQPLQEDQRSALSRIMPFKLRTLMAAMEACALPVLQRQEQDNFYGQRKKQRGDSAPTFANIALLLRGYNGDNLQQDASEFYTSMLV